jgi:cysteine desulfurase/selenocysteine lyase
MKQPSTCNLQPATGAKETTGSEPFTMTLDALRAQFPHTTHTIYLNHAATGPLSRPVLDAIEAFVAQRHEGAIENYYAFQPVVEETLARLARLLGTQPERVAFMPNTSYGLSLLAEGLAWEPGDRIAVPACEFPANVYPFMNLERYGVVVDFISHRDGTIALEDVEAALHPRTRLLTLSWVQFLSGFRADVAAVGALCRDRGVLFSVDAIQGLGALRLDVEACGIDFLACGSHKWLMGTQGFGLLYVTEALQEQITPPAGWLHGPVDWDNFFDYRLAFHPDARRYHLGTLNNLGIAALHAALGLYFEAGPAWCEAQVLDRARALADGLVRQGLARYGTGDPAHASGIVTVRHAAPEALFEHLQARNIAASLRNRLLRFAPTYYNSPDEVDRTLEAVADFDRARVAVP